MNNFLPVSPRECQGLTWLPPADCLFAFEQPLLTLTAAEMGMAAASMPLALVKRGRPARWELVAVCGLHSDRNLFVDGQGRWLGQYRPQSLNHWPFSMMRLSGRDQALLLFDRDSGLLREDGTGEPFFDDEGKPSSVLAQMLEQLKQVEARKGATEAAIQALASAGLLTPWPETVVEQTGLTIEGLHCVDERALAALDDTAFMALRRALPVAYGVNFSLYQTHLLARLARLQGGAAAPAGVTYEDVFGEEGSISFDGLLGDKTTH